MTDQLSAKDWLDQGLKTLAEKRLYGAEGRAAGEGDGGVARQLLLAFRRHRRVPCRDPETLARGRRRADHCRPRGCSEDDDSLPLLLRRAFPPGRRWRTRSAPGRRSMPWRGRRCRPSTGGGSSYIEILLRAVRRRRRWRAGPRANPLLGFSRLCAVGPAIAESETAGGARGIAADGLGSDAWLTRFSRIC